MELFEQLAGVAMAEDGVGGEIVGGVHEVGLRGGRFACAADAGFGVADDAVVEVDEMSLEQRSEREDDAGGVAAGVGNKARGGDLRAVEFGRAVDGFGLQFRGGGGIGVVEVIDGAVLFAVEPPGTREVDHTQAVGERVGDVLARLLVWRGEEEEINSFLFEELPVIGEDAEGVGVGQAGELWLQAGERDVFRAGAAEQQRRRVREVRMVEQQAHEFAAGISADSRDRGAQRGEGFRQCRPQFAP